MLQMQLKIKKNLGFIQRLLSRNNNIIIPVSNIGAMADWACNNYQFDLTISMGTCDITDLTKLKNITTFYNYGYSNNNPTNEFRNNYGACSILNGKALLLYNNYNSDLKVNRFSHVMILTSSKYEQDVKKFIEKYIQLVKPSNLDNKIEVYAITQNRGGLDISELKVPIVDVNINTNYNDSIVECDTIINKHFTGDNNSGLIILHGERGTGKTMYIRSLVQRYKNVKFIILNSEIAANLTSPALLTLLSDINYDLAIKDDGDGDESKSKLCFIIEDGEALLVKRGSGGNDSGVSTLLNLTDGIIGASLEINVIATFNTDLKNIDPALKRKGRLITSYEFTKLNKDKAINLAKNLGIENPESKINKDIRLTDIYNIDHPNYDTDEQAIGFKN